MRNSKLGVTLLAIVGLIGMWGCGGVAEKQTFSSVGSAIKPAGAEPDRQAANGQAQPAPGGKPQEPAKITRQIIYRGFVDIVVDNIDDAINKVQQAIQKYDAYIQESSQSGQSGYRRDAKFVIRVPVTKYEDSRAEFAKIGILRSNRSESDDVTEEVMDLEARLKILRAEEEALQDLLKKVTDKLEEILKVRDQLVRNREQIEKAEGRLRYLTSQVSYSTITLDIEEDKAYEPPTKPTFGESISRTFERSILELQNFGKNVVIAVVGLAPWTPLILLGVWLTRRLYRRMFSKRS